jgi:hypothetical protein
MGLITDMFEESIPGMVVGAVATAILMPLVGGKSAGTNGAAAGAGVGAAVRGRGRQLMKAAVRGYVGVADRLKEATAEAREQVGDLVAEVREERRMQAESAERDAGDGEAAEKPAGAKSHRKRSHNGSSRRR